MEKKIMKKLLVLVCATATLSLAAGSAFADSIKGRVGVTGKIGFTIPADGDFGPNNNSTDTDNGFIGGAGVIYGVDNTIAVEADITRSTFGSNIGDFDVIDLALGAQYRFALSQPQLVPFVGAGLDFLMTDADGGNDVDNTFGVHAKAGVDYFLMKQLALTAEAKLLVAPDADINGPTGRGNFDPTSLSTTVGVRYFFN
jgi:outer membrane protein